MRSLSLCLFPLLLASCKSTMDPAAEVRQQYHQVFEEPQRLRELRYSDESAWEWQEPGVLALVGPSRYVAPYRSPVAVAMIPHLRFTDFVVEMDMLQTGREYGHRDLCIVFGFVDPANFYYVHLATSPDATAHNVFIVDDADRRPLAPIPAQGVDWGTDTWHHVLVERDGADIRVYFDDMENPVLEASDATHPLGSIGFGSFDDTGLFDNIRIWSNKVAPPASISPF